MKKIKYQTRGMESCFYRVIELNQKMLILTRFVTKNDFFFISGSRKLKLIIFKIGEYNRGHFFWGHVLIV